MNSNMVAAGLILTAEFPIVFFLTGRDLRTVAVSALSAALRRRDSVAVFLGFVAINFLQRESIRMGHPWQRTRRHLVRACSPRGRYRKLG